MTIVLCEPGVKERTWTKKEYYHLGELGFFQGQRVELIGGRLMVFSPQNAMHAGTVSRVDDALRKLFPATFCIRCQLPIDLGLIMEPEPDAAVVQGTSRQFLFAHPTTSALIVEVSDTTLSYDRVDKGSMYACAGITEYWIVNLVEGQVEVYRDPVADPTQPYGWRYNARTDLTPPATVTPLAGSSAIAVADLLP